MASVAKQSVSTGKLVNNSEWKYHIKQRLYDVREMIDNHVEQIHTSVTENVKQTIKYIQNVQKSNRTNQKTFKRPNGSKQTIKLDSSMLAMRQLWDQVASPEESMERDFGVTTENNRLIGAQWQTIKVERREFRPRMTNGEEKELLGIRLTKGEQIEKREAVPIDSQIDRFKRQNGKTVNMTIENFDFHTYLFHMLMRCYYRLTFTIWISIIQRKRICKYAFGMGFSIQTRQM